MHEITLDGKEELWEVKWQNSLPSSYPPFPILSSPIAGGVQPSQPVASKQAYRLVVFSDDAKTAILNLFKTDRLEQEVLPPASNFITRTNFLKTKRNLLEVKICPKQR